MDKTILSLLIIGIALSTLHIASVLMPLVIIGGLAIATIRLFWTILQAFSTPTVSTVRPCPVRNS